MQLAEIYQELESRLTGLDADMRATESHGVLCARFCMETRPDPAAWVQEVIGQQDMNNLQVQESQESLARLYLQTEQSFHNALENFDLLLPADDAALPVRLQALVDWCSGFLSGLGLGGLDADASLSPEVTEIMQDFAEITRMDVEVGKDDDETNESALTEIEEYVRVGVMTIGLTLRPRSPSPTIH